MKYLTILVLLFSLNAYSQNKSINDRLPKFCCAASYRYSENSPNIGRDYNQFDSTGKIINAYPLVIFGSKGNIISYMKKDRTWVITDSIQTLKRLLSFGALQNKSKKRPG